MNIQKIRNFEILAVFMGRQILVKQAMRFLLVAMISAVCLVSLLSDTQAALQAKIDTFTAISGTGDQSISGVGF